MNDSHNIYGLYVESNTADISTQALHDRVSIDSNGDKVWWRNNKFHRIDGPAIIYSSGEQEWYLNGVRHREDGPAVIHPDGYQSWWFHGKRHREDGPAIILDDNRGYEWWLNGKYFKTPENWAKAVLIMHKKPHDDQAIQDFLRPILKKDIEDAL